jgi:DNA polymerase III epsilon subunit-like protein
MLEVDTDSDTAQELGRQLRRLAERRGARVTEIDASTDLPWVDLTFLALDTETTGLSPSDDRVIEVAWVRHERGQAAGSFEQLVDAGRAVPDAVVRLTGIDDDALVGMPSFDVVADGIVKAMEGVDFVAAYNAGFDRAFLEQELARCGRVLPDVPWIDPLVFIREVDRYKPGKKLKDASRRWGVGHSRPHRALADAEATGRLLLRVAPFLPSRTLADLLDQQRRWAARQAADPPPHDPPAESASVEEADRTDES